MPRSDELPEALAGLSRRHALDLPDTAFHQTLGRLIDSLRRDEPRGREQAQQEPLTRVEPAIPKPEAPRTRVPRWAIAALVGAALAVGGAVVYLKTQSRPAATMQTGMAAAGRVARTGAGSGEAVPDKGPPKMDTTMARPASATAAVPRSVSGGNAGETSPTPASASRTAKLPPANEAPVSIYPTPAAAPRMPEPPALRTGQTKVNPKDGLTYVWIRPGPFTMGCSPGDNECSDNEKPTHREAITTGFWMAQTPVTQQAYQRVTGVDPSHFKGPQLPVETVNWNEAKSYCEAVAMRLPTEAEWEYAARAGTTGSRYGDLDEVAWYDKNSGNTTHPVGLRQPNAFGLYDMLGNVWQWTSDNYDANTKVVRGGSWDFNSRSVRASDRGGVVPAYRNSDIGFRCAGELR